MSIVKHKIFISKISFDKEFDIMSLNEIDAFLRDDNIVYLNHSVSVASEQINQYQVLKETNHFAVISIVFKDLKGTPEDLTSVSSKTQGIVKKSKAEGEAIPPPNIQTDFEKNLKN